MVLPRLFHKVAIYFAPVLRVPQYFDNNIYLKSFTTIKIQKGKGPSTREI